MREMAGVLSLRVAMVFSRMSNSWAAMSAWATTPACSKSLLVMSPLGLSSDTSRCWMWRGYLARHSTGSWSSVKSTPPIPRPHASTAPRTEGLSLTISPSRVGRDCRLEASSSKSSRWFRICWVMRTRCLSECRSPSCKAEKRPELPGMARDINRSSPMVRCHALRLTRFLPRRPSKIS